MIEIICVNKNNLFYRVDDRKFVLKKKLTEIDENGKRINKLLRLPLILAHLLHSYHLERFYKISSILLK